MKITQILMDKPVYLGLSTLEISKIVMYQSWYDYVKPKYGEKGKLRYMDIDSFIVYIKTDIYKDIAENVDTRLDTSNYELNRPLMKVKNMRVIGGMKDELGGKIIKELVGLRAKTCSYLIDDGSEDNKKYKKIR